MNGSLGHRIKNSPATAGSPSHIKAITRLSRLYRGSPVDRASPLQVNIPLDQTVWYKDSAYQHQHLLWLEKYPT